MIYRQASQQQLDKCSWLFATEALRDNASSPELGEEAARRAWPALWRSVFRSIMSLFSPTYAVTSFSFSPTLHNVEAEKPREQGAAATSTETHDKDFLLAQKIVSGNERAFRTFYQDNARIMLRRLVRMTGDPDVAEDCLQQLFTEAIRSLHKYRGEGPLRGWLHRIASHVVMDHFRRKHRWKDLVERVTPLQQVSAQQTAAPIQEEFFLREELRQLMHQVIDKLSPRKRMVVLLCDLEGMGIEEAAAHLDVPMGTVASRLHHGRHELRKLLELEFQRQNLNTGDWFHA